MTSQRPTFLRVAAIAVVTSFCAAPAFGATPLPAPLTASPLAQTRGEPAAAARKATAHGNYGLIWGATLGSSAPLGVTCLAPAWLRAGQEPNLVEGVVSYSDSIGPDSAKEAEAEQADTAFGDAYNAVVLASPDFPYRDVCRTRR